MTRAPLLSLATLLMLASSGASADPLEVSVDPRIEAVSIVCRLAGLEEYATPTIASYGRAVDDAFGRHVGHPAVLRMRALSKDAGIRYNAPVGLALLLDPVTFEPRVPLSPRPAELDTRWSPGSAAAFAADLAEFVRDTGFLEFHRAQAPTHRAVVVALRRALASGIDLDWYRANFAVADGTSFRVVPMLLSRRANYAASVVTQDGAREVYQLLATLDARKAEDLDFPSDAMLALLVHELAHPFVNPWVDANSAALMPSARALHGLVQRRMAEHSYGAAEYMAYESVVRATAIRYAREHGLVEVERLALADDRSKGFLWTDDLARTLAGAQRPIRSSATEVAEVFARWAADDGRRIATVEQDRAAADTARRSAGPQLVRLDPPDGAAQLAAGPREIAIVFDRPMGPAIAVYGDPPEILGAPRWSEDRRTLTLPVRLEGGRRYELRIGSDEGDTFVGVDGTRAVGRTWTFSAAR